MKLSIFKTITSLAKGLIKGKRKESVAMESYLKCIPTIQTLIDKHLLGINLKERLIVMDISVHLMFISTRLGKDMSDADKRYASFIDKVVAFMNFQLGRMGANDFIDTNKTPIHFIVTQKEYKHFDEDGNPLPAHRQISENTLFVGQYKNGIIDYREYNTTNG